MISLNTTNMLAGTIIALPLIGGTANAAEKCQDFTVISDNDSRQVKYVDHAAPGLSHGDQRMGYVKVTTKEGKPVGTLYWLTTVMDANDPPTVFGQSRLVTPEGVIMAEQISTPHSTIPDESKAYFEKLGAAVTNGVGVYEGATGTVKVTRGDNANSIEFKISCN